MEEKPRNLWKSVDPNRHQVILIHIITNDIVY